MKKANEMVSLLTGAAGGIGREIALLLDKEGYTQVLIDINKKGLAETASGLSISPCLIDSDITNIENVRKIKKQVLSMYGKLDVLINNAGVVVTTPFDTAEYDEIEREFNVNYKSIIYLLREFLPVMKSQGRGNIVSVCSLGGIMPLKEAPGYCGTKFGLRGFMLSQSIALKKSGIHVSCIYPTAIDTPMLHHEALHGGSLLNFLSDPLQPVKVAKAVVKAIKKNKMEISVPGSEGFLCKLMGSFPALISGILPLLEPGANRNRLKYIKRKNLR
jgi:short-subunit dehydrogenase